MVLRLLNEQMTNHITQAKGLSIFSSFTLNSVSVRPSPLSIGPTHKNAPNQNPSLTQVSNSATNIATSPVQ